MRVISGTCRGIRLDAPRGMTTRPTVDRVKEGIFSSINFIVPGARVLDLFAGSGQMGIESLSRGAYSCVFVDIDKNAVKVVKSNLEKCSLTSKARVYNAMAESFISRCTEQFDIIFLDPPYNMGTLEKLIPSLYDLLRDNGIIIAESELGWTLDRAVGGLVEVKKYKYGNVLVTKFQKETEE